MSTLLTSTIQTDYLTVNSSLNTSTILSNNGFFNTLSTGQLFTSNGQMSTLLTSTIQTDYLTVNSTLSVSTINSTGTITFNTILGDVITANTITVNSSINVSTINTTNMYFQTLSGQDITASSITTQSFTFSSLCMIPSTVSTFTGPATSSILICLNGNYWKIPIEPA
jgi:hypothetical protein